MASAEATQSRFDWAHFNAVAGTDDHYALVLSLRSVSPVVALLAQYIAHKGLLGTPRTGKQPPSAKLCYWPTKPDCSLLARDKARHSARLRALLRWSIVDRNLGCGTGMARQWMRALRSSFAAEGRRAALIRGLHSPHFPTRNAATSLGSHEIGRAHV